MLVCQTSAKRAEIVTAVLFEHGASAITERDVEPGIELQAGFASNEAALSALSAIPDVAMATIKTATQEWVENQREGLAPVEVGPWRIRAPWHPPFPPESETTEIVIDPGAAFGHGAHPSTALILSALPGVVSPGDRVVDLGTGTGVLAIAAA